MDDGNGPAFIHLGLHKTASTWIQNAFLPKHPDIVQPLTRPEVMRDLAMPDAYRFDMDAFWEMHRDAIDAAWADGKTIALSHERFAGVPIMGALDRPAITQRVHETFPEAKVWLVLREPASLLASLYNQHIRGGGRWTLERYLDGFHARRENRLTLRYFDFAPWVADLQDRFGRDNVRVDLFEEFIQDKQAFLDGVCDWLDVGSLRLDPQTRKATNTSLSPTTLAIMRFLNLWLKPRAPRAPPSVLNLPGRNLLIKRLHAVDRAFRLDRREKRDKRLRKKAAALIGDALQPSMQELDALIDRPLAEHGYLH